MSTSELPSPKTSTVALIAPLELFAAAVPRIGARRGQSEAKRSPAKPLPAQPLTERGPRSEEESSSPATTPDLRWSYVSLPTGRGWIKLKSASGVTIAQERVDHSSPHPGLR